VWEISREDLHLIERIGGGTYGSVFMAAWRDLRVAVKTVQEGRMGGKHASSELDREISMLQTVRHPNIVLFFGAGTFGDGTPFLVTELLEMGSLDAVLHDPPSPLDWGRKLSFALDTCSGMAHLHSLGRMHRDLKSSNLLVSASLRVKVADFGTAEIASLARGTGALGSTAAASLGVGRTLQGSPLWMAPELLARQQYGPSADVYSFGIVAWEIASQAHPWEALLRGSTFDKLRNIVLTGTRPEISPAWPAPYVAAMTAAWAGDPNARPSFADLRLRFSAMREETATSDA
jgi:serine/threonine protein kinase